MKNLLFIVVSAFVMVSIDGICQSQKVSRYFSDPVMVDSASTIFFPTRYNEEFFSDNKIAAWGSYYSNIVVYDFKSDVYRRLFDKDTFIESFKGVGNLYDRRPQEKLKNIAANWVLLLVKNKDNNNNGRVDERDPSSLFVVTNRGENLRQLTDETINVVSFEVYEKQGFALIEFQDDTNHDKSFKNEAFYYRKLNLDDLTFGKKIEIEWATTVKIDPACLSHERTSFPEEAP